MRLERADWLVADKVMAKAARRWWIAAAVGLAMEVALLAGLWNLAITRGWVGTVFSCVLALRVITGCIGAWGWATFELAPSFWGFRAKWVMGFFPAAMLSLYRHRAANRMLGRLAESLDQRIELAVEQIAYYRNGAAKTELGPLERAEMACWTSALAECWFRMCSQRERERMKSAQARSEALEALGLGRASVQKSLLSIERLEISTVAGVRGPEAARVSRRL